ncbi:hypothetical protein Y032_0060g3108 [Ancylostoma ceylanicum]|uniref:Uncharacterized protein n=1 Tax=Ancylostoma ceylanicum TaxID=53326 RepID=A0A016U472_9BILA|nr:hypothetical protein Y032_0060g3108 [Ancylostoma ceylanicum]
MCTASYAAIVGFTFKLFCRLARGKQLAPDHRFWAKVSLMEVGAHHQWVYYLIQQLGLPANHLSSCSLLILRQILGRNGNKCHLGRALGCIRLKGTRTRSSP